VYREFKLYMLIFIMIIGTCTNYNETNSTQTVSATSAGNSTNSSAFTNGTSTDSKSTSTTDTTTTTEEEDTSTRLLFEESVPSLYYVDLGDWDQDDQTEPTFGVYSWYDNVETESMLGKYG
jgi:hypothetical protein